MHVPWSMCGGRKTTYKSSFFPSTKWVPEIEVRLDSKFLPPEPSPWPKSLIVYHCFPGDAGSQLAVGAPISSALL